MTYGFAVEKEGAEEVFKVSGTLDVLTYKYLKKLGYKIKLMRRSRYYV